MMHRAGFAAAPQRSSVADTNDVAAGERDGDGDNFGAAARSVVEHVRSSDDKQGSVKPLILGSVDGADKMQETAEYVSRARSATEAAKKRSEKTARSLNVGPQKDKEFVASEIIPLQSWGGVEAQSRRSGIAKRVGAIGNIMPLLVQELSKGEGVDITTQDEKELEYMCQFLSNAEKQNLWGRWREARRRKMLHFHWRLVREDYAIAQGHTLGMNAYLSVGVVEEKARESRNRTLSEAMTTVCAQNRDDNSVKWREAKARVWGLLLAFEQHFARFFDSIEASLDKLRRRGTFKVLSIPIFFKRLDRFEIYSPKPQPSNP